MRSYLATRVELSPEDIAVAIIAEADRFFFVVARGIAFPGGGEILCDYNRNRSGYAMFLFAKSQLTMFQNASMNLGRALR